ncbi:hypothetical protein CKO11_04780 [Rhodobacter sp. TJ_12]|uniref:TonB family protein n=1 Tax=Rhodobacter sp. TJ_12 TaxID=2029399 RepID=UPI001CBBF7F8|nr:TonB family protein [Rhodobacter sp. TJ_12]MBZ4021774.1 hypothetical protein [Rhodobacter sp. TJ_12]
MSLALPRPTRPFHAWALGVGLLVSLVLHGAAVALIARDEGGGGAVSAGDRGQDVQTLAALEARFVDLPPPSLSLPAPEMTLPLRAPEITVPQIRLPDPVLLPRTPPKIQPAPQPPEIKPNTPPPHLRPKPKPAQKVAQRPPAPQPSESRAATRAAGTGETEQASTSGQTAQPALAPGQAQKLLSRWGMQIRSRIERRKRYPASAGRAAGAVGVTLVVSREGALISTAVGRSSGHPALDAAALAAVRKAGRFPAAPAGLSKPSYAFSLSIKFAR